MSEAVMISERDVIRYNTKAWFEGYSKIAKKNGDIESPRANVYQERISDILQWGFENGRPVRLVCLKPRQKGSSTFSVAALYRRIGAMSGRGLIAGGAHFQGSNLFKILKTYAKYDELNPCSCSVRDMNAVFANGGEIERITLANSNAGRSGTYQAMVLTEVAYLSDEGVSNADEVLNGLLKCVPYEPLTFIIQESTAKGAAGKFYEEWQKGITFEEFKAGRNGYVQVFAAWFEFEDSWREPASEGLNGPEDMTEEEEALAKEWGLTLGQVAFMRWAIRDECNGDFDRFCQDYPFDSETAFLKSGTCRFGQEGLKHQNRIAKVSRREFGVLNYNDRADRVSFVATAENEARCVRFEGPRVGCRYLLSADTMTGDSQTSGKDPDSHGIFVLRAGYMQNGIWHPPVVVMRNMLYKDGTRFGNWWDIDVVEEEVWRMAKYYQAVIAPEMNMDRGMVELLKLRDDADIYQREVFNQREQVRTKQLGWMTTVRTRETIIENLARMVRETGRGAIGEGIEIRDPWTLKEMANFVRKANGRSEAAPGHHDDSVMGLAIGAYLVENEGTPWHEQVRRESNLDGGEGGMGRRGGGGNAQWS